jgi:fermentation-respiration switch protein FrsA (DUF1100 family)
MLKAAIFTHGDHDDQRDDLGRGAGDGFLYGKLPGALRFPAAPALFPRPGALHASTGWPRRRAAAPTPSPVLLYFHGNGGGLYLRRERIEALAGAGYGVFIVGYRGYSGSTGRPTEKALVADGLLAYDYLTAQGVAPSRIVLYGESLGTGIATQVASQRQTSAVILEAPYGSVASEAKAHFGIFPIDWLLLDRFDSMAHIGRINVPLLIMHGSKDSVIPARSSHALFDSAKEPKSTWNSSRADTTTCVILR